MNQNGGLRIESSGFQHTPVNRARNKIRIALSCSIILLSTCILPTALYFILKDAAYQSLALAIGVPAGIFGAVSVITYLRRAWSLTRSNSTSRPINGTRWSLDYFQYNFTLGLVYISALISYATSTHPANPRIAALPLSLLVAQVCIQLLVTSILTWSGVTYPFTVSSMSKGTRPVRPAIYTIIEDVLAVDGGAGTAFRQSWNERYQASPDTRTLLGWLSLFWGCSGLVTAAGVIVAVLKVTNEDIGWALGWTVPWAWAAIMAGSTKIWARRALYREKFMMPAEITVVEGGE